MGCCPELQGSNHPYESCMFRFFRIMGASLRPELDENDIVLALTARRLWRLRPGQRVIFHQVTYGTLVKKIDHLLPDGRLFVTGTAVTSVDSYEFGPVSLADVVGVVLKIFSPAPWRTHPPAGRSRRTAPPSEHRAE